MNNPNPVPFPGSFVVKNGGRIYLKETKVGEGTIFRLEFPIAVKEEAKAKT